MKQKIKIVVKGSNASIQCQSFVDDSRASMFPNLSIRYYQANIKIITLDF